MRKQEKLNLHGRLVIGFLIATGLTGLFATIVGIRIINDHTRNMVNNELKQDISTARLIYDQQLERLQSQLQFIVLHYPLADAIRSPSADAFAGLVSMIRSSPERPGLDMLTVTDHTGRVVYRAAHPENRYGSLHSDPLIARVLAQRIPITGSSRMTKEQILSENPALESRMLIPITQTPHADPVKDSLLTQGLALRSAYPIMDRDGTLIGLLTGGILVNRDYGIVDKIKEIEYGGTYKGHDLGFATIFLGPVRISTNVMTDSRERAIGTVVSQEVASRVLRDGLTWIGRAFVVNDWYISAYVPILDIDQHIIGMLYTGILESRYRDLEVKTLLIFLGVTLLGMSVAFFISFALGTSIIRKIRILKLATEAIAAGDLSYQLPRGKSSGFDMLDESFNNMAKSLKERDERLQKAFSQIMGAERLSALGQMAAGVAHEINNPLGGILLYSNLVLEDMDQQDPRRENMEKIIYQTHRCKEIVQNLLDFTRTPSGEMIPLDINAVIQTSINLVKDQPEFSQLTITTDLATNLPRVSGDRLRLEEVFLNLLANAADAMQGSGTITIQTAPAGDNLIEIIVADDGPGIDEAHLPHIFEPFFSTKEPGIGTGLGLSISYSIIRNHNGSIRAQSKPGQGTCFTILLPAYVS